MTPEERETMQNNLMTSRANLVVALRQFCNSETDHEPCLNYRDCDECHIREKIDKLKFDMGM
jgi:hypothetical protein